MKRFVVVSAALLLFTSAVTAQWDSAPQRLVAPPAGPAEGGATLTFTAVTAEVGLTSMFTQGNTHTGGVAWIDYNGDHWSDLFITNGSGLPHYLYRNNGDGTFTDVSSLVAKPDPMLESAGVLMGDIENDGDTDLIVYVDNPFFDVVTPNPPEGGENLLYVNQGDGTFLEQGLAAGIRDPRGWRNITGGLADYDRDGYLDLYLANWQIKNDDPEATINYDNMFHNDGDGTFTVVTEQTRTDGYGRDALVCLWFDCDLDMWPDLYVGNINAGATVNPRDANDVLYVNAREGGVFYDGTGNPEVYGNDALAAMGMDVGDIDADGDFDLYITDITPPGPAPNGNVLYLGSPEGVLSDNVCDLAGLCATDEPSWWPTNFADFDLDGWVDLWMGSAFAEDWDFIFLNDGDGTFTQQFLLPFLGNQTRGGTIADFDGDGDVDILFHRDGFDSVLMRNDTPLPGNWIEFKLSGTVSNRSAIGALIRVTDPVSGLTQMRRVSGGDSAHSHQDLVVHFGLGAATTVNVEVRWPAPPAPDSALTAAAAVSGGAGAVSTPAGPGVTRIAGVPVNQLVFIDEDVGVVPETITVMQANYVAATGTIAVAVRSSRGGRTELTLEGFGPMAWSPTFLGFQTGATGVTENPGTVTVTSEVTGESWVLTLAEV